MEEMMTKITTDILQSRVNFTNQKVNPSTKIMSTDFMEYDCLKIKLNAHRKIFICNSKTRREKFHTIKTFPYTTEQRDFTL